MKLLQRCFLAAFLLWSSVCLNGQYYLYDDDCLDFYATDYPVFSAEGELSKKDEHQIIPFCRYDNFKEAQFMTTELKIPSMTFEELNKRNISSLQLYTWSIHMDLVEEYQAFRENNSDIKTISSNLSISNCSAIRKFGLYCQYSFNTQVSS
jgi:hypothetical protein